MPPCAEQSAVQCHTPEGGNTTRRITHTVEATTVAVENGCTDIVFEGGQQLFDRSYRANAAQVHPDIDSSGLGLAITRAIAQAHGGSVTASSGQGRTCFTLVFPHRVVKPRS
ncbi:ATP-binding protein [Alicycliphilus sp. T452]